VVSEFEEIRKTLQGNPSRTDLYAFLVNYKHSLEVVAARTAYYKHLVRAVLHTLGVPDSKVHFVDGSSYELNKEFSLDNYKLSVLITDQDIRATADEYAEAARMSVLMCPNLPCLAEEYLDADFQFGGEDQVRNLELASNLANCSLARIVRLQRTSPSPAWIPETSTRNESHGPRNRRPKDVLVGPRLQDRVPGRR
jgi:hypothetical protein